MNLILSESQHYHCQRKQELGSKVVKSDFQCQCWPWLHLAQDLTGGGYTSGLSIYSCNYCWPLDICWMLLGDISSLPWRPFHEGTYNMEARAETGRKRGKAAGRDGER